MQIQRHIIFNIRDSSGLQALLSIFPVEIQRIQKKLQNTLRAVLLMTAPGGERLIFRQPAAASRQTGSKPVVRIRLHALKKPMRERKP